MSELSFVLSSPKPSRCAIHRALTEIYRDTPLSRDHKRSRQAAPDPPTTHKPISIQALFFLASRFVSRDLDKQVHFITPLDEAEYEESAGLYFQNCIFLPFSTRSFN